MLVDIRMSRDAEGNYYRSETDPLETIYAGYDVLADPDQLAKLNTVNDIRARLMILGGTAVSSTVSGEALALVEELDVHHANNIDVVTQHFAELPYQISGMLSRGRVS